MPVYFVQAGEGGPIKIGYAANVARRISSLQTASSVELRPLGIVQGGVDREHELHDRFRAHRKVGEWFDPCAQLLSLIADSDPLPWRSRAGLRPCPAWDEIERLGRELGAGDEAIRKWRIRGVPAKWQLRFMAADPDESIDRAAFNQRPGSRRAAAQAETEGV